MFWWGLLRMSLTIYPLLLRIPQAIHPVATLANIEREGLLQKPSFAFPTSTRFDLQAF